MSKFWRIIGLGAAIAAGMYLFDPDRGRSRRARLADQAGAAARKAGERAQAKARYQKGVFQGIAHDLTEPFRPDADLDDDTLRQKVKSEAIGRWDGQKRDIEVDVEDGVVTLRGPASSDQATELIRLVEAVPGVGAVNDELSVPQRS
jgi:osmotically-inducible protein OsmY